MINRLKLVDILSRSSIHKNYLDFKVSQYSSTEYLDLIQWSQFKKLISHAYNNVPYYRNLMNGLNLRPSDFKSIKDLVKLPVLTKSKIKEHYNDLKADNLRKYHSKKQKTGGSTGEPLEFLSDRKTWSIHWALKLRSWEMGGYILGEPVAFLGGRSLIPDTLSLKKRLFNKIMNFQIYPSLEINEKLLLNYIKSIRKKNIQVLRGYPDVINQLAQTCLRNDIKLPIKLVISTADTLRVEHKKNIKRIFSCIIIDSYGSADGGGNASTCEFDNGFHISTEVAIWEVTNKEGELINNNEIGDVTLTSLTNYAMPFIRYQPGDLISSFIDYSQCRCQRNLPKIKKISGRSADSIKLPNGRSLNGHSFSAIIKKFAIDQWQIIESKNQIEVKILPSNQFQKSDMHKFMNDLNLLCRDSIEIKVTISKFNDFVTSKSGKNRVIIKDTSL